jgi:RimJ/RimL family protein N-acetyltransferase
VIATCRDELVGFLVSHRGPTRRLRHRADFTMAVLRRCHRRGIGRQLLEALSTWAVAQNITRVELTVMSHNSAAIALYQRAGYRREGLKRGSIRIDGRPVDEVVMGKSLDSPR